MLEPLAFADGPFSFQSRQSRGEKGDDRIFPTQDRLAFVVFESQALEFEQRGGLGGIVAETRGGIFEGDFSFEVVQGSFHGKNDFRWLGGFSETQVALRSAPGLVLSQTGLREEELQTNCHGMGADHSPRPRVAAWAEVFDIDRVFDAEPSGDFLAS